MFYHSILENRVDCSAYFLVIACNSYLGKQDIWQGHVWTIRKKKVNYLKEILDRI